MKRLYLIGGTMGVGKTTVCQQLKSELPNSVFLDGDWCWDADPFQVTDETKNMVLDNICHLLNNFIHCSAFDNIIFGWVMHEQSIIDIILRRLETKDCDVITISLIVNETSLKHRIMKDICDGARDEEVIERSIARIPLYQKLNTIKIDTNGKTVRMISGEIRRLS